MTIHQPTTSSAYIKSLRVRGFKSFGEEAQKFTFTRGINLIVGANGSGKSNILDAISFALCAKISALRVRYNADLQSTDTKEACEVVLEFAVTGNNGQERLMTLSVTINPDDSRHYRVDGKVKSFKDVKEMLQDIRLYLEGSGAVVHQSRVTELADSNSSKLLVSIISDASGAGRWNEEVERAQQELKKTRKGLDEIQENILLLEKIIEKDQACLKVLSRIKQEMEEFETSVLKFEALSKEKADFVQEIRSIEEQIKDLGNNLNRQKIKLEENRELSSFLKKEMETRRKQLDAAKPANHSIEDVKVLDQAVQTAKDEEVVLQGILDDTLYRQEKISAEKRELQEEVLKIDELIKTVHVYEDEIQLLAKQLLIIENTIEDVKKEEEERSSEFSAQTEAVNHDKLTISEMQGNIQLMRNCILNLRSDAGKAEKELENLPLVEVDFSSLCKEKILNKSDYYNKKRKLSSMMEDLKKLKLQETHISIDEKVAFNEQMGKLELFKERWISIAESIDILTEGIENTRSKVQIANETTYKEIRQSFVDCCKVFLPTKRVDLIKIGQFVEDGIKFSFSNSKAGSEGVFEEWKSNLEELSGGQRTVLSLAFILMVAKCSRSSVYLMDEIDAALDEQNQQSVAMLIKSVIGEDNQVICVSHNITFQRHCDRIIQVSRVDGCTKHIQSHTVSKNKLSKKTRMQNISHS